ncbi:hypothetical protein JCM10207_004755 [Rhodosporidiobolus poonsookiae]
MSRTTRWRDAAAQRPTVTIVAVSLLLRMSTSLLLVVVHALFPSFDPSAALLDMPWHARLEPFVRWDAVHFLKIARDGYSQIEQSAAFMPGIPLAVLRGGGSLVAQLRGSSAVTAEDAAVAGMLATALATTAAAVLLHRLTLRLFPLAPPSYALLAALLWLLAPSRPTLHAAPYTEPFATFFTFAGMLAFSSSRRGSHLLAALGWGLSSMFRAQGAVLGFGFFGWRYLLDRPFRHGRLSIQTFLSGLPAFALLSTISAAPFLAFQVYIYQLHCSRDERRPWCDQGLGLSYGWIQREYWNVGPFRYWTLLQLPNFLLALPVLALAFSASYAFYRAHASLALQHTLPFLPAWLIPSSVPPNRAPSSSTQLRSSRPLTAAATSALATEHVARLVPFVHLSTALYLLLFTTAHVQIALRVCVCDPVVWWWAAELVLRDTEAGGKGVKPGAGRGRQEGQQGGKRWGAWWVGYCVVWGTVSVVLWALFLPPA